MDDPQKIAMVLLGRRGEKKTAEADEGEGDDDYGSAGADAFADAVKLAMKGDKQGAFEALKVAVSACQDEA